MLPTSQKRAIVEAIKKIDSSSFTANDVKLLLIDIREIVDQNSFTKELAHFIAHPKRDQGLCYNFLNLNAMSLRRSLGENILSTPISVLEINKKIFDLIFIAGIKRWKQTEFQGKNRKNSDESTIRGNVLSAYDYDKKKGVYIIKNPINAPGIVKIVDNCLNMMQVELASASTIISTLNNDVKDIYKKHLPGNQYNDVILKKPDEIMLCIFSLFQDSQFQLYDGTDTRFLLHYELQNDNKLDFQNFKFKSSDIDDKVKEFAVAEIKASSISLYGSFKIRTNTLSFGLITSNILIDGLINEVSISDYIDNYKLTKEKSISPDLADYLLNDIRVERNEINKLVILKN